MTPLADLFAAVHAVVADTWSGRLPVRITIHLHGGEAIELPVPPATARRQPEAVFVPTPFQEGILTALEGKALRTDALGAAVGDRSRLYKPGGLKELRDQGLVSHHHRLGYFRPDAPPEELAGTEG